MTSLRWSWPSVTEIKIFSPQNAESLIVLHVQRLVRKNSLVQSHSSLMKTFFLLVSSMVLDNAINTGILLYALHLRFMCPFPKRRSRSVHKCKSDTLSAEVRNIVDIEPERSFYLYDDMRVVFPHRHSDSDEGKVCKYVFDWSGLVWRRIIVRNFTLSYL